MNNDEKLQEVFSLIELSALYGMLAEDIFDHPGGYARQSALAKIKSALENY